MDFVSPEALALIPLIIGLVQIVKTMGVEDRYAPLASLILGIALGFFVFPTVSSVILGGIAIGLMASGLYSGTRAMTGI